MTQQLIRDGLYWLLQINTFGKCYDWHNWSCTDLATNADKTEGYYDNYPRGVCEYVKKTEKCVPKFIFNLNKLYYCTFRQNFCSRGSLYLFIPISFFIMFFALHLLGSSADEYLTASLE